MAEKINSQKTEFLGELRLGRQLSTVSQVASGGLLAVAGLTILLVDRTIGLMGAWGILAGFLACLAVGLTLLNVVELLAGTGERGGSYTLVHETLGDIYGFLTGWAVLAGSLALTAALARLAAEKLVMLLPNNQMPTIIMALLLIGGLILVQVLQIVPQRIRVQSLAMGLIGLLIILLLTQLPKVDWRVYQNPRNFSVNSLNEAVAWLSVIYIAFEALQSNRSRVRQPVALMPNGILRLLMVGGSVLLLALFVTGGMQFPASGEVGMMIDEISSGPLPAFLVLPVILLILIMAANSSLMIAARQVHALSQEGALPEGLRKVWDPVPMPISLFGLLGVLIVPLVVWAPEEWLVYLAATLFLVVMTMVDIAAIYSRRTETERRRTLELPFFPVIPSLAIVANLVLVRALPLSSLAGTAVWLLIGIGYFLVYARERQLQAQEGEVVFGRIKPRNATVDVYRILVPIGPKHERHRLLRMANALAHQMKGEIIPLQVVLVPDPLALEEGRRTAQERNTLFSWSTRAAAEAGVPVYPITRLARNVPEGIIDTAVEENADLVLMSWPIGPSTGELRIGSIVSLVARNVSCDVAVFAHRESKDVELPEDSSVTVVEAASESRSKTRPFRLKRILVPTAGGPHAPLALRLALLLARDNNATVGAVYVIHPDASEEEMEQGQQRIHQTLDALARQATMIPSRNGGGPILDEIQVEGRVIEAENVVEGIAKAGADYDLVLIGASEESLIDRFLFGNIPERVAVECPTPVMIVKRYRGLPRQWLRRAWDTIFETLPTLNDQEQIEVYRAIHRGSRPDVDFFVMIGLSTLIAVFGLLLSSSAVIIGAMLVAPLFSPLLAVGLSIVQGNVRLLRLAVESTLKGVVLAIFLAALIAWLVPLSTPTPEMLSRTQPSLYDLAVALFAGMAGAYAIARKDVAAALAGVAIAAALVPPLGVVGIGLAMGNLSIAGGSTLLLATNLIAIALSGSLTFLLLGFRPGSSSMRTMHLRRGLVTTATLFVLIAVPLAIFFIQSVQASNTRQQVRDAVTETLLTRPNVELTNPDEILFSEEDGRMQVTVPVYRFADPDPGLAQQLSLFISQTIQEPVTVRVIELPAQQAESGGP